MRYINLVLKMWFPQEILNSGQMRPAYENTIWDILEKYTCAARTSAQAEQKVN